MSGSESWWWWRWPDPGEYFREISNIRILKPHFFEGTINFHFRHLNDFFFSALLTPTSECHKRRKWVKCKRQFSLNTLAIAIQQNGKIVSTAFRRKMRTNGFSCSLECGSWISFVFGWILYSNGYSRCHSANIWDKKLYKLCGKHNGMQRENAIERHHHFIKVLNCQCQMANILSHRRLNSETWCWAKINWNKFSSRLTLEFRM